MAGKQQNAKPTKSTARAARMKAAAPVRERKRTTKSKAVASDVVKAPANDTRFKPGQSGNPKGRPRKERSLLRHLEAELDAEMQVTEGGKVTRLTKREALAKSMVNKALQGDHKMLVALLKQLPVPRSGESQEHYSVRLETVLRLLTRKGQAEDADGQEGEAGVMTSDDPDDALEGDDQ